MLATPDGTEFTDAGNLRTKTDAAGAVDTAGKIGGDQGTDITVRYHPFPLYVA